MNRNQLETRFIDLTEVVLPSRGRTENWPVTEPHAFVRIVLDHVFGDCWSKHVKHDLHAIRQLNDGQLGLAIGVAERLAEGGPETIHRMAVQSLEWRKPAEGVRATRRRMSPRPPVPASRKHRPLSASR